MSLGFRGGRKVRKWWLKDMGFMLGWFKYIKIVCDDGCIIFRNIKSEMYVFNWKVVWDEDFILMRFFKNLLDCVLIYVKVKMEENKWKILMIVNWVISRWLWKLCYL